MFHAYPVVDIRRGEAVVVAAAAPGALMRTAAAAVAFQVCKSIKGRGQKVAGSVVLALVGSGDNGGDALFALAQLQQRNLQCHGLLLGNTTHQEAMAQALRAGVRLYEAASPMSLEFVELVAKLGRASGVWIDAIVGTGARGALREPARSVVKILCEQRELMLDEPIVIAVDIPSGIDAQNGSDNGEHLRAEHTVTMGGLKNGALLPPGAFAWGEVSVVDLGLKLGVGQVCRLVAADLKDLILPPRIVDHKYRRGVVSLCAGSQSFPGASVLTASGAVGFGPGMVAIEAPERAADLVLSAFPQVVPVRKTFDAAVIGPGMDPVADAHQLAAAAKAARANEAVQIWDAGALTYLAASLQGLGKTTRAGVLNLLWGHSTVALTPHYGEAARLATALGMGDSEQGVSSSDIGRAPAWWAAQLATELGCVVVLKAAITLIAAPTGPLYSQAEGPSWLATAGSGDVLAGILGAFAAQQKAAFGQLTPQELARICAGGVWLHGAAARLASRKKVENSPATLPRQKLLNQKETGLGAPISPTEIGATLPEIIGKLFA